MKEQLSSGLSTLRVERGLLFTESSLLDGHREVSAGRITVSVRKACGWMGVSRQE
jgi:hypothetical protein